MWVEAYTRGGKNIRGGMLILRMGRRHLDCRVAWRLPWEAHLRPVNAHGHHTADGWLCIVDLGHLHARFQYHRYSRRRVATEPTEGTA